MSPQAGASDPDMSWFNKQAIELYQKCNSLPADTVEVELIKEYIFRNYCQNELAKHHNYMEDVQLLLPLAKRWENEIQRHANEPTYAAPNSMLEESVIPTHTITA